MQTNDSVAAYRMGSQRALFNGVTWVLIVQLERVAQQSVDKLKKELAAVLANGRRTS